MPYSDKMDVAIVGAGIVGLAHAYLAARAGNRVTVFERNPAASGASIRNFGMVWPIGQPPGTLHRQALRSRELWLQILAESGLPYLQTGSLHAAYRDDEAELAREFAAKAPALGYACQWLNASETLARSHALRPQGLLGALWSSSELTVDPRHVLASLPAFLHEKHGIEFHFDTSVTSTSTLAADAVIVASGDDFQTLYPDHFRESGITRCKLQMLRTVPQPNGWQLGPSLAFGLSFTHYPTFQICEALPKLRARIAHEEPDLVRWGIHVMVSQTSTGELTLGDSHEYGLAVEIFDKPEINRLILDFAARFLRVPTREISQTWHGVYAKHSSHPYIVYSPEPATRVVTVTSGIGMTMSFGLAEQVLTEMGII